MLITQCGHWREGLGLGGVLPTSTCQGTNQSQWMQQCKQQKGVSLFVVVEQWPNQTQANSPKRLDDDYDGDDVDRERESEGSQNITHAPTHTHTQREREREKEREREAEMEWEVTPFTWAQCLASTHLFPALSASLSLTCLPLYTLHCTHHQLTLIWSQTGMAMLIISWSNQYWETTNGNLNVQEKEQYTASI
jgi:hypothetical protein